LEELEEEVSAFDLLAIEGGGEDENEEVDENTDVPESVDELKALLAQKNETIAKRNKSLKKAKQAQHRTQGENTTLQDQFEALEAKVNGIGQPDVAAENLAKEEQEWQDRVADDPTKVAEYMEWKNAGMMNNLSAFLGQKFGEIEQSINGIRSETDPEKMEYRSEIAKLKANPQFANLDDDTALTVAKALKSAKVPGRGGIGGKKVTAKPAAKSFELSDEDKQRMGFG